jgi:hypothetical protein
MKVVPCHTSGVVLEAPDQCDGLFRFENDTQDF